MEYAHSSLPSSATELTTFHTTFCKEVSANFQTVQVPASRLLQPDSHCSHSGTPLPFVLETESKDSSQDSQWVQEMGQPMPVPGSPVTCKTASVTVHCIWPNAGKYSAWQVNLRGLSTPQAGKCL